MGDQLDELIAEQGPPPDLDQTLDEYYVEQFLMTVEGEEAYDGKMVIEEPPPGYTRRWFQCTVCGAPIAVDLHEQGNQLVYNVCTHAVGSSRLEILHLGPLDVIGWYLERYGVRPDTVIQFITRQ